MLLVVSAVEGRDDCKCMLCMCACELVRAHVLMMGKPVCCLWFLLLQAEMTINACKICMCVGWCVQIY